MVSARFDQTLSRLRAVRLRDAIEGQGLSVEAGLSALRGEVDATGCLPEVRCGQLWAAGAHGVLPRFACGDLSLVLRA